MRGWTDVAVVVVGFVVLAGVANGGVANEPPQADAGLDQNVPNGSTVYLDAGGSVDPDGSIDATEWTVVGPNGSTVNSSCTNCTRTHFTPTQTGQYNATVTVTDDDGATRNDTLYVTVREPKGPEVTVTGPVVTPAGQPTNYTATANAGEYDLQRLVWFRNDSRQAEMTLSGDDTNRTLTATFDELGNYTLLVSVSDARGYVGQATRDVRVVVGGSGGSWGGGESCPDGGRPTQTNGNEWWCRQTAIESTNDRLLILSSSEDDDRYVEWTTNDGQHWRIEREAAEDMSQGNTNFLTVSEMTEHGTRTTRTRTEIQNMVTGPTQYDNSGARNPAYVNPGTGGSNNYNSVGDASTSYNYDSNSNSGGSSSSSGSSSNSRGGSSSPNDPPTGVGIDPRSGY